MVTSGDRWKVEVVVNQLGLAPLFAAQVTINDVQRGKPAPDPYLLAAQRLGQAPERCLVFEDAVSGVKAAVAAGATCIGVQASAGLSSALHQAGAYCTIADFTMVNLQCLVNPDDRREMVRYLQLDSGPSLLLA
jgi:sugar-phosphatase